MGNAALSVQVAGRTIKVKNQLAQSSKSHYACVYAAEDEITHNEFALKMVRIPLEKGGGLESDEAAEHAQLEHAILRGIPSHPNIVETFECGEAQEDGEVRYWVLSEFCPRSVLGLLLDARRSSGSAGAYMPERDIMWILRDVLMALLHLHSQKPPVAHRDLKPEKLLIGSDGRCKLCNFSTASVRHRAYQSDREINAAKEDIRQHTTPEYRAPEQVNLHSGHVVSEAVDIWAVGVLLCKLAFGKTPFDDARDARVQSLGIMTASSCVPSNSPYSQGLASIIELCMDPSPASRPTAGQVLKQCQHLLMKGVLPYWPSLTDNGADSRTWSSASRSDSGAASSSSSTPTPTGANGSASHLFENGANAAPSRRSSSGSSSTAVADSSSHSSSTNNANRRSMTAQGGTTPGSPRWLDKLAGGNWGEGVMSKWYKLLGGEQQKRLWVLKTTSAAPGGPKTKYLRKLVAALWDGSLTLGGFFQLLRYRPLADNPIVAVKALITLMRVLQHGPPHCLMEITPYVDVVDEIGQMWVRGEGSSSGSAAGGGGGDDGSSGAQEAAFAILICRLAAAIVQKVRFHQHHPEYSVIMAAGGDPVTAACSPQQAPYLPRSPTTTPASASAALHDSQASVDHSRAVSVVSRLLAVQDSLLRVLGQAFLVLARGSLDAQITTRALFLPLIDETYDTYLATRRMLLALAAPRCASSGSGATSPWHARKQRQAAAPAAAVGVVAIDPEILALAQQCDAQVTALREFYARADFVEEVRAMRVTGTDTSLPYGSVLDEALGSSSAAFTDAAAAGTSSASSTSTVVGSSDSPTAALKTPPRGAYGGRAQSKLQALRTLRHEEKVLHTISAQGTNGSSTGSSSAAGGAGGSSTSATRASAAAAAAGDDNEDDADDDYVSDDDAEREEMNELKTEGGWGQQQQQQQPGSPRRERSRSRGAARTSSGEMSVSASYLDGSSADWSQLPPPSPGPESPQAPNLLNLDSGESLHRVAVGANRQGAPPSEHNAKSASAPEMLISTEDEPAAAAAPVARAAPAAPPSEGSNGSSSPLTTPPQPPPKPAVQDLWGDYETLPASAIGVRGGSGGAGTGPADSAAHHPQQQQQQRLGHLAVQQLLSSGSSASSSTANSPAALAGSSSSRPPYAQQQHSPMAPGAAAPPYMPPLPGKGGSASHHQQQYHQQHHQQQQQQQQQGRPHSLGVGSSPAMTAAAGALPEQYRQHRAHGAGAAAAAAGGGCPPPLPPRRASGEGGSLLPYSAHLLNNSAAAAGGGSIGHAASSPPPLPPRVEGMPQLSERSCSPSAAPAAAAAAPAAAAVPPSGLNLAAARQQKRDEEAAARERKREKRESAAAGSSTAAGGAAAAASGQAAGGSAAAGSSAAAAGAGPAITKVAVARYDYTARSPGELSFKANDRIKLHSEKVNSKGWGLGEVNGKMGWFPGDFVKMQSSSGSRGPSTAMEKTTRAGQQQIPTQQQQQQQQQQQGGNTVQQANRVRGQNVSTPAAAAANPRGSSRYYDRTRAQQQQQQQQQMPLDNLTRGAAAGQQQQAGNAQDHTAAGAAAEEMLPEHMFAIQMARAQPWKDRLTSGGKQAYADLISFFNASGMVIDFNEVHLKGVIGSGAFATVFKAIYRRNEVAVKKLVGGGGGPMEKTLKDFKTEAALLSRLRHRNIIAPVGATCDPVTVVMEYCSRGNLMVLLNDATVELSWAMKKQMCLDVAHGMEYLHTQNPVIIHRDLKSLNVLIDENWVTKVTDFGLSRFKATSVSEKMTGQAGTYHWMAPEVINSQHYTEKADVFSFGIILWETYTRAIPYDGMQPVQVVAAVLGRRERPRIPSRCPPPLAQLMQQCWAHDPNTRPSFKEIVPMLENLP